MIQKIVVIVAHIIIHIRLVSDRECNDSNPFFFCISLNACIAEPSHIVVSHTMQQIYNRELPRQAVCMRIIHIAGCKRWKRHFDINTVTK